MNRNLSGRAHPYVVEAIETVSKRVESSRQSLPEIPVVVCTSTEKDEDHVASDYQAGWFLYTTDTSHLYICTKDADDINQWTLVI